MFSVAHSAVITVLIIVLLRHDVDGGGMQL